MEYQISQLLEYLDPYTITTVSLAVIEQKMSLRGLDMMVWIVKSFNPLMGFGRRSDASNTATKNIILILFNTSIQPIRTLLLNLFKF